MGWFIPFLRSHARKASDTVSKELYKLLWKMVVVPILFWAWSLVYQRITEFGRLRNSFVSFLRKSLPEPDSAPSNYELWFFCSTSFLLLFYTVYLFLTLSPVFKVEEELQDKAKKLEDEVQKRTVSLVKPVVKEFDDVVMQDLDGSVGSISLLKSAVQEFNDIVMKDLDSCEGDNFSGKAIPLLAELNSELLKYDRTTVAFCTDQLIHLDKMKRILEEFKDASAMIVCQAQNCSALMTIREGFFLSNKEWL